MGRLRSALRPNHAASSAGVPQPTEPREKSPENDKTPADIVSEGPVKQNAQAN